ncbi:MAG TPA: bifunctional phosphoglucose/phosphomannose isomerase [Dehalococcoidia bacterium]|nr:bifunctional phosphoglucose/phosphomannose isomerase [Dehalococcoidia bacterium]
MHLLDDPQTYARLDPDDLRGRIRGLPEQCREAWQQAKIFRFPRDFADVDGVLVLGMGGSAIAGDIVRSLAMRHGRKPVFVHRGYDLPQLVGERSLVVACSYSGETEEVLSSFGQSLAGPAKKMVITTGGKLLALAQSRGLPAYVFAYQGEPRSALGHSLMPLLALAEAAGVLPDQSRDVDEAVALMEELRHEIGDDVPLEKNAAKQLAVRLQGKLPVVYGAEVLTEAAHRWKTQLNENGKVWAFYEEMSELNHNAVEGFALPKEIAQRAFVVFLYHRGLNPRNILRYNGTHDALEAAGVASDRVEARGEGDPARILTLIHFGDWVSYYLAMLNGVRPSPVTAIQYLKKWLAES